MRIFIAFLLSLALAAGALADTLITNVTAITMDGKGAVANANVVVRGDRIIYVGVKMPDLASITGTIDGTGKFLTPGLAEMHGHLPSASADSEETKQILFLYLAGGVTTVRGMLGNPVQFDMRKAISEGTLAGPTLYLAAPSLNGNSVSSVADGIAKVKRYKKQGWDLLKIHPGLTNDEYHAIAKTARDLNLPFGGHVPADVGIVKALAAKQTSIDHMDGFLQLAGGFDEPITDAALKTITNTYNAHPPSWIVPTQALFGILISGADVNELATRQEVKYMPRGVRASWSRRIMQINGSARKHAHANRQRALKALSDTGALMALGSDAPQLYSVPGFSIWREIETMAEAGISAEKILKIGTRNPGDYFADKDRFGQIAVGMRADLLLLDADPRLDAANLTKQSGVMAAGRWYSRETLDARLAEIAVANR